jgi:hypothetical protein
VLLPDRGVPPLASEAREDLLVYQFHSSSSSCWAGEGGLPSLEVLEGGVHSAVGPASGIRMLPSCPSKVSSSSSREREGEGSGGGAGASFCKDPFDVGALTSTGDENADTMDCETSERRTEARF